MINVRMLESSHWITRDQLNSNKDFAFEYTYKHVNMFKYEEFSTYVYDKPIKANI